MLRGSLVRQRWVGGGWLGNQEGKQVVVEEYLDFRSRFRPPKRMDDGTLKVENVVVLFLYCLSFFLFFFFLFVCD